ncbi:MAG: hydantoinase/oxoprolinase family protein [Alphaproteobacteria bacterium]
MSQPVIAGVDVGGTFTDLVLIGADGSVRLAKTPTTADNQAGGVLDALDQAGAVLADTDLIVHGTTTTTNAVLERKLARTGMITTRGFRDVIEVGRRTRPQPYGMTGRFVPVIPRDLRLEVTERVDATGAVLQKLAEDEVRACARALLARGCEALVVHFLHAYANPEHERLAAQIAAEVWPNAYITAGHALLSEFREFERGVTASVNAAVQPILDRYVSRLQAELTARGFRRDLLVMNGNGGMVPARDVAREAAKTVMSGPASGVMAAAYTCKRAGIADVITYDMGGTSSDVAVIRGGVPAVSGELEIEYAMPIHVPMVDVHTIGSGGGSIARVDGAGLLQVGPESAGARPGPIHYGRGGERPTISDANVVLGRLSPERFLPGDGSLTLDHLRARLVEAVGRPLGLDAERAAAAILRIADMKMAGAIRMVSIGKGLDPRDFALFAFGGSGPLHATALAAELGIPRVLVPARPGITNALGCVVADFRHDFVNTVNMPLDNLELGLIRAIWEDQVAQGARAIAEAPVPVENVQILHAADMQFVGQTHLLRVEVPSAAVDQAELQALFAAAYDRRFRVELPEIRANLVNLATSVIGARPPVDLARLIDPAGRRDSAAAAQTGSRPVWFASGTADGAWHDTPVYWRDHLPLDPALAGPAVIEQMDTTVLVEPGCTVGGDADGNLIVAVPPAGRP